MATPIDAEDARLPMGPLAATVVLSAVTGYVDAFAYVNLFGTFPANQSGNVALLGIALGQGELGDALTCIVAVASFALGVAVGVAIDRRTHRDAPYQARAVLLIELVLLAAVTVAIGVLGEGHEIMDGPLALALLVPTGLAMGVQTPAIARTHGIPTPTTYMTGSVAHLAEAFATRRVGMGGLLLVVLSGYVGGAVVGTAIGAVWNLALVVPTATLALLLIVRTSTTVGPRATSD